MLKNINSDEIIKNSRLKSNFLNATLNDLNINCNIYEGNFYLDSFNYFIINEKYETFKNLFTRDNNHNNQHFFSEEFYKNFIDNINNFKNFENIFILGSNAANNYYSNLIQFLPRIFFMSNKKIKIAIHRNSSNKFRDFVKLILDKKNIKFSFIFLDDGFYKFTNSYMPQFLSLQNSINVLKNLLNIRNDKPENKKIYVTREDSHYRKIINEADIIPILRSKGYKVINPQLYKIEEQINIFSKAEKILAPHGSNLSNIVFCKPGTEIHEVGPQFENEYEKVFENRYKNLAQINNLKYFRFLTDTVPVKDHSKQAEKYIDKKILENSNYYKNLIVKIKDINDIL